MEEPTVLDFILDKLVFWRKSTINLPAYEHESQSPDRDLPGLNGRKTSWQGVLYLLPGLFAITAQVFSEPDNRSLPLVIFFYITAIGSLLLLIFLRNWKINPLLEDEGEAGELTIRWIPFGVGVAFSILAYLFFLGNLFTVLNTTFWIVGFSLIWWSIWVPENWWIQRKTAVQDLINKGITITPWGLLVLGVFVVAGFYRFYLLDQVPPEMFSDHAEKLIDVTDVMKGNFFIFFPRNTGREAFQMYLTAAAAKVFGTGISFLSLKLGTCLAGLFTLPFIYLLGKEIKNKEVGLLAMFFAGIAYWPNVISRVALRFTLYPAFAAPALFFLVRGLKRKRWNDFLFAGIALGFGLHGYSTFRIFPLVIIITLLVYFLHSKSKLNRKQAIFALVLVGLISLIIFLPLLRFALSNFDLFAYRMQSRLTNIEQPLPGPYLSIFFSNLWKSLVMFQWDNGQIWVHSIPNRPALDVFSAGLFSLGIVLIIVRYIKHKNWLDLMVLLWIPLLLLPSVLSIAFPDENPSLNRSGGAIIPVFLVIGLAVENLLENLRSLYPNREGKWISTAVVILLAVGSMSINAKLVFGEYYDQFKKSAWNTSEIGHVIEDFSTSIGDEYHAWVIPYPHWVDTRLVGIQAIGQVWDFALWQSDIASTQGASTPKLYIYKPDDLDTQQILKDLYPDGYIKTYQSEVEGRDFMLFYVMH